MPDSLTKAVEAHVEQLCRELGPGGMLPGERELAQRCGVSRMTVRHAIEHLMVQPLMATSFHEDMRRRGLVPSSRLLWSDTVPADPELAGHLEIPAGEHVLRVCRVRLADDEPMTLETLRTPCSRVPGLTGADLVGDVSFYAILTARYHRHIASGKQSVAPVVLDGREAELLGVSAGQPALRFVRTSRDQYGDVVERVESVARGDRYLIEVDLIPPARSAR
jgi:GntR family transcriptional regulator